MKLFSEDTLSHYGIPGQKKGIRRWQYPDGRFNEEGKIRYFGYPKRNKKMNSIRSSIKGYSTDDIDYYKYLKYALIGSAIITGAYVGYNYYSYLDNFNKEQIDPETGFRLLNKQETMDETLKNTNPYHFGPNGKYLLDNGYDNNCFISSITADLRQRGYDVTAGFYRKGFTEKLYKDLYKNYTPAKLTEINLMKSEKEQFKNELIDYFKSQPNNSRGAFNFRWRIPFSFNTSGHSIFYKIENNKLMLYDTQIHSKYSLDEWFNKFGDQVVHKVSKYDLITPPSVTILRTDNLELNIDKIKEYVQPNANNIIDFIKNFS